MPRLLNLLWRYRDDMLLPLGLAVLTALYMMPALRPPTGREALDGSDLVNQQYPLYSLIFDAVRNQDEVPLWNPYQFSGQSIAGNPQSTIFYPPAWLMAVVGVTRGVGWLVALHLFGGAWGMALCTRRFGASPLGAFAGGAVYGFSALMGAHLGAGHFNYMLCQAWLPWVATGYLWACEQRRLDGSLRARAMAALPGAAALGLCALAGYPPLLYFGGVWLIALWMYVAVTTRTPWRAVQPLLVIVVIGAALGAAMLLPVGAFTLDSTRAQQTIEFSNSYAMPGGQLLTLVFPNMFGHPRLPDQGYWGLPFYEELTAYVGILPLLAVFLIRRRPADVLFGAFLGLGIVVSLGMDGGLFTALYYLMPGYSLFRVPSRSLYFVVVGAAGLVALLITDLPTLSHSARRRLLRPVVRWFLPTLFVIAVLGSLILTSVFTLYSQAPDVAPPWRTLYSGNMLGVAAVVIGVTWVVLRLWILRMLRSGTGLLQALAYITAALVVLDVWHIAAPMVTVSAVDIPPHWALMVRAAPASPDFRVMTVPNNIVWQATSAHTRHLNASGYDPLLNTGYQTLLDASRYDPTSPVARLLGVRYFYTDKPYEWARGGEAAVREGKVRLVLQEGEGRIYEVANPAPRVFVSPKSELRAGDSTEAIETYTLETAVLDRPVDCPRAADNTNQGTATEHASITGYTPNRVAIRTETRGGILTLTDTYDPNWRVSVDGAPVPLLRTYAALRGVCLTPGSHEIVFSYRPTLFYVGVAVSTLAWAVLAGIGILIGLIRLRRS